MTDPQQPAPTATDDLLAAAARYAATYSGADLSAVPQRQVALVVCMDTRIDVLALFGLAVGQAHVLRNAGGVVTDDVIRSLVISQRKLGTREVVLVHHTQCGMATFTDDEFKDDLQAQTGIRPAWSPESFRDAAADVAQSVRRVRSNPFLPHTDRVRGFVFDVASGRLAEVTA